MWWQKIIGYGKKVVSDLPIEVLGAGIVDTYSKKSDKTSLGLLGHVIQNRMDVESTEKIRAEVSADLDELLDKPDADKYVVTLWQRAHERLHRLPIPYDPDKSYGATAETKMWHAFRVQRAGLDNRDKWLEVLWMRIRMAYHDVRAFDAWVESMEDNHAEQHAREAWSGVQFLGHALDRGAGQLARVVGEISDLIGTFGPTQRGASAQDVPISQRIERMLLSPRIPAGESPLEQRLRQLEERRAARRAARRTNP